MSIELVAIFRYFHVDKIRCVQRSRHAFVSLSALDDDKCDNRRDRIAFWCRSYHMHQSRLICMRKMLIIDRRNIYHDRWKFFETHKYLRISRLLRFHISLWFRKSSDRLSYSVTYAIRLLSYFVLVIQIWNDRQLLNLRLLVKTDLLDWPQKLTGQTANWSSEWKLIDNNNHFRLICVIFGLLINVPSSCSISPSLFVHIYHLID